MLLSSIATASAAILAGTLLAGSVRAQQADSFRPQVLVVPVQGVIDLSTVALIRRASREAAANGIGRIVLRIDTPGGELTATRSIQMVLDGIRRGGIHTVAYVEHQAFSAGAYIALACHQIFMAPPASIGAITQVQMGPLGIQQIPDDDVRDKAFSVLRSEVRALVQQRGDRREGLELAAEAFVDPRMRLFEVTHADAAGVQERGLFDEAGLRELEARGVRILNSEEFRSRPLTLTAQEAVRIGLASGVVATFDDLMRDEFGLAMSQSAVIQKSWSEESVHWLNGMKPFFFLFGFLLLLIELKTPGFAVPGALGLLMLGLAMFSSYLVGLAQWTEIILLFVGIGLMAVEIFVLPGTIIFGLMGFLTTVAALVLSQQTFVLPSTEAERDWLLENLLNMAGMLVLAILGAVVFWKLLPRIPILNRVLLQPPEAQTGAVFGSPGPQPVVLALVGRRGIAATDLRPAGIVELHMDDGSDLVPERLDVVADGGFIERGQAVRVREAVGNRVVVEPIDRAEDPTPGAGQVAPDPGQQGEVSLALLVLLIVVGFGLVVAEVFLVSFGVLTIAASVALVSAVFLAFTHHGQATGFTFLVVAALGAPLAALFALRRLPSTRLGQALILSGPSREQVANASTEPGLEALLHQQGVAVSDLRPAGFARIRGQRVDVVTRGEPIDGGTPVRVVQVEGNRVVVAKI